MTATVIALLILWASVIWLTIECRRARRALDTHNAGRCGAQAPVVPFVPAIAQHGTCHLRHGHRGWHRADSGTEWNPCQDRRG